MIRREKETGEAGTICFKQLDLVTPEYASRFGLVADTDEPVFISTTDSTDRRPFIYRVGATIGDLQLEIITESFVTKHQMGGSLRSKHERPRYGIGYSETHKTAIDYRYGKVKYWGWVAIVEPTGIVLTNKDDYTSLIFNRITNELKVNQILAFCRGCLAGPLERGIVAGPFADLTFAPVCSFEKHKKDFTRRSALPIPKLVFEITETSGVVFERFEGRT